MFDVDRSPPLRLYWSCMEQPRAYGKSNECGGRNFVICTHRYSLLCTAVSDTKNRPIATKYRMDSRKAAGKLTTARPVATEAAMTAPGEISLLHAMNSGILRFYLRFVNNSWLPLSLRVGAIFIRLVHLLCLVSRAGSDGRRNTPLIG